MRTKNNSRFGFTLAEMMIVMLILTIILAAFAPLMTKRKTVDLSSPWRWAANNSDIYYGMGANQTAMIGQKDKANTDPNTKLLIKSDNNPALTVKNDDISSSLYLVKNATITNTSGSPSLCFGSSNVCPGNNTSFGYNTLSNVTDKDTGNTAFGTNALAHNNGKGEADKGDDNTVEPFRNTWDATSGHLGADYAKGRNNTAIGPNALTSNIGGHSNVAIGSFSLATNESGPSNIAIGAYTLKSAKENIRSNIAIGTLALGSLTKGNRNIAIGSHAFNGNGAGGGALKQLKEGENNIAIGESVFSRLEKGNDNIAIGAYSCAGVTGSNKICIGSDSGPGYYTTTGGDNHEIWLGSAIADNITVYIGKKSLGSFISEHTEKGSDKRLKNISGENKYGLDVIRNLKTYIFSYKDDKTKTPHAGIIAQDLQKYIPDAIKKDEKGFLYIREDFITYSMLNAIKELDATVQKIVTQVKDVIAKVTNIETQIKTLQKENKELKSKVNSLEKRLEKLEKKAK